MAILTSLGAITPYTGNERDYYARAYFRRSDSPYASAMNDDGDFVVTLYDPANNNPTERLGHGVAPQRTASIHTLMGRAVGTYTPHADPAAVAAYMAARVAYDVNTSPGLEDWIRLARKFDLVVQSLRIPSSGISTTTLVSIGAAALLVGGAAYLYWKAR